MSGAIRIYRCPTLNGKPWIPARQCVTNRARFKATRDLALEACKGCPGVEAITEEPPREYVAEQFRPPREIPKTHSRRRHIGSEKPPVLTTAANAKAGARHRQIDPALVERVVALAKSPPSAKEKPMQNATAPEPMISLSEIAEKTGKHIRTVQAVLKAASIRPRAAKPVSYGKEQIDQWLADGPEWPQAREGVAARRTAPTFDSALEVLRNSRDESQKRVEEMRTRFDAMEVELRQAQDEHARLCELVAAAEKIAKPVKRKEKAA